MRQKHSKTSSIKRSLILCAAAAVPSVLLMTSRASAYDSLATTFQLIAIPDPQYYSVVQWKNDQYYADQMNWIVQNKDLNNIAFVYGLGDNVQNGNPYNLDGSYTYNITPSGQATRVTGASSIDTVDPVNHDFEAEWKRASADWDILGNANVPYYAVIGNHDYYHWDQKKDPFEFVKYFGASRYEGKSWWGGASPVDKTQPTNLQYAGLNAYTYFNAGGYKFLNISIQFEGQYPQTGDLTWAQSIINANPGIPTIISTHDYQNTTGRDASGNFIWNGLVKNNSQIFMVLSGHVNGVHQQTSTDTAGQPVLEMLSDFQDTGFPGLQNGGGYLRTLTVNTAANTIHVQTYSTVANSYLTTGSGATANDFTLNFNFAQRFGAPPLIGGDDYIWDPAQTHGSVGGGAGNWDMSTSNWSTGTVDGTWAATTSNDTAVFAGTAGTVTVAASGVSANDMIFKTPGYVLTGGTITMVGTPSIDTTAGAATVNNVLAGAAGLTLTGGGVTLAGANTFSGGLTISGGANLTFTADNNLGAAAKPVTIDGGTLTYTGNINSSLTENRAFAIGADGATINIPNAGPAPTYGKVVISGANLLSGAGDIIKTGQGWLTVYNSNNNYGGNWNVNGGVLEVGGATSLGTGAIVVNSGGELANNVVGALANSITVNTGGVIGVDYNVSSAGTFSGPITANGNFDVRLGNFYSGQSQKVTLSGGITGAGTLRTVGPLGTAVNPAAQVLSLTGDNSSFSGGFIITTGTVTVGATNGKPLGTGSIMLAGGKLALQGQATQNGAVGTLNPVAVSGFNKDVIYGTSDSGGTTTVGLDNVFSFFQNLYVPATGTLNAGTGLTGGLASPSITSTLANSVYQAKGQTVNTPFTLQSFTANNALQFAQGSTGSLTLNAPGAFGNIAILATSTFSNEDTPNVTIHFTDGTTATTTYKAFDWSMGTDSLRLAASALGTAGIDRYSPAQSPGWDQRPFGLYETDIDLTNINGVDDSFKLISSITFNATSSDTQNRGKTNIFAISGAPRGWVTGTSQNYTNAVVVSSDSSIDISGSLNVTMSSLSIGSSKLSITSSDSTTSAYSLNFSTGSLTGSSTVDVAASSGGGAGKLILGPTSGTGSLTKTNTGSLELTGINTYSGSTTLTTGTMTLDAAASLTSPAITTAAATTFNANGTLAANTTLNANGTVNLGANPGTGILNRTISALNLTNTGTVNLSPAATKTNRTVLVINGDGTHSGLTFSGSANTSWQGKMDLANNDLVIKNANFSDLASQLQSGFNAGHGYWNGSNGISSSTAANDNHFLTTIGYRPGGVLFDGITTTTTSDALVKYTYYGDADLSGSVDGADYQQIDNGFGNNLSGWSNGDFNYDGVVNGSDFALIDNTFNQLTATGATALALVGSPADQIAAPAASPAITAVPEPTTLGLLSIGVIGLLQRKRRVR